MGTRHLVCVELNGQYKVAQYGQFDGYPDHCGVKLKDSLNAYSKQQIRNAVSRVTLHKMEEIEKFLNFYDSESELLQNYPFIDRHIASDIIDMLVQTEIPNPILFDSSSFAAESLFCEWAYVINLDDEFFEVYRGFQKEPHPVTERFTHLNHESDEFYPVKHLKSFGFDELANLTEDKFVEQVESLVA